jgi:integrase
MPASKGAGSRPYTRNELRALQAMLDQRWPRLPPDEPEKWLPRFREGRSPYSRVRVHAISTQLDAIIALALHLGLRRSEMFRLSVNDLHYENAYVVVRGSTGELRGVPWTSRAHFAVHNWLKCRDYLGADHDRPWLNLHAAPTVHLPMTRWTFDKLLVTYVGSEWTYSRLRVTGAVAWARAGLPLERLRQVLGFSRIEDVLPFAQLAVTGTLERDMARVHGPFMHSVEPGGGWSNRPLAA